MNQSEGIIKMVSYLELAQSKGIFTLREAREIADSIDAVLAPPVTPETPETKNPETD